jgi:hypothetical protein
MPARATVASTAAIVAAWAAIGTTVGCAAACFATGAEVAEVAGELCVEGIVEADRNGTIARRNHLE